MIGRDSHHDMNRYGPAPWIFGLMIAVVFSYIMFSLALPIGG